MGSRYSVWLLNYETEWENNILKKYYDIYGDFEKIYSVLIILNLCFIFYI